MSGHEAKDLTRDLRAFREHWPPGPWQHEPDRLEWRDPATGLTCLILRNDSGILCGYVACPPGHPWHGKDYDDVPAEVHGGLTYAKACAGHICHVPKPGEPDDVWWVGFDTAHAGDVIPGMVKFNQDFAKRYPGYHSDEVYRDVAYVTGEVTLLAQQVATAGGAPLAKVVGKRAIELEE